MNEAATASALRVYRALLSGQEKTDPDGLAEAVGLTPGELDRAVDHLRRLGLLGHSPEDRSGTLIALPPRAALRTLLDDEFSVLAALSRQLDFSRAAVQAVATSFQDLYQERLSAAEFEVVRGRDAVRAALESASAVAEHSVAALHPGPMPSHAELERGLVRNRAVLDRGVQLKTVHLQGSARLPHVARYLEALREAGGAVRLAHSLPTRLIVVDARLAILPATPVTDEGAIMVVRSGQLVRFIEQLFEHFWSTATVPRTADAQAEGWYPTPVGQEAEVLFMLAGGMRDEGMARRLGVSVRTVRRTVAKLMEQLGVESRFEAGVAAAKAGWLD